MNNTELKKHLADLRKTALGTELELKVLAFLTNRKLVGKEGETPTPYKPETFGGTGQAERLIALLTLSRCYHVFGFEGSSAEPGSRNGVRRGTTHSAKKGKNRMSECP